MKILYIETFRDNFDNVFGTTMLYESNGQILKYETKSIFETTDLLNKFLNQMGSSYNDMIKGGFIKEYLIGDLENGNYRPVVKYGYELPNISLLRHRRADKYNKYQGPITWKAPIKNNNKKNKVVHLSNKSKINIKPMFLALIVLGSMSLTMAKGVSYIGKNVKTIQTTNYNGNIDENFINRIFKSFVSGNEHKVSEEELDKFVDKIDELYKGNLDLWNGDAVGKSRKRSAITCNFSNLFDEGTKDKEVLKYFEGGYNNIINEYLGPSSPNYEAGITLYCKELYNFVLKKSTFKNTNIRFSDLSPVTQLVILEMFENCADTVDFYCTDYYAYSKQHETIYNTQIMNAIEDKKDSVISGMKFSIELNGKIRK